MNLYREGRELIDERGVPSVVTDATASCLTGLSSLSEETINLLSDRSKTNTEIAEISGNHPITLGAYRRHRDQIALSDAGVATPALNRIKFLANFAGRPLSRG